MDARVDPLRPLVTATRALSALVGAVMLLAGLAAVFGAGSVLTLGDDSVCVAVTVGRDIPVNGSEVSTEAQNLRAGIAPGVSNTERTADLCQEHPGFAARALGFLTAAPEVVLLLGFVGGVWWLLRQAQEQGLFSRAVANAVEALGWWVLGGTLVAAAVQAWATSGLVTQMIPGHAWLDALAYWHLSVSGLLAGAGLLTIARVMRVAVDMRRELDAVV